MLDDLPVATACVPLTGRQSLVIEWSWVKFAQGCVMTTHEALSCNGGEGSTYGLLDFAWAVDNRFLVDRLGHQPPTGAVGSELRHSPHIITPRTSRPDRVGS